MSEPWALGTGSSLTLKHCRITVVGVKFKPLYEGSIASAGPCIRPAHVETLFLQTWEVSESYPVQGQECLTTVNCTILVKGTASMINHKTPPC